MESFVKYLGASGVKSHALSSFPKKPFYSWRNEKVSFTKKAENKIKQFLSSRTKDKRTIGIRHEFRTKVTPRVIGRLRRK